MTDRAKEFRQDSRLFKGLGLFYIGLGVLGGMATTWIVAPIGLIAGLISYSIGLNRRKLSKT